MAVATPKCLLTILSLLVSVVYRSECAIHSDVIVSGTTVGPDYNRPEGLGLSKLTMNAICACIIKTLTLQQRYFAQSLIPFLAPREQSVRACTTNQARDRNQEYVEQICETKSLTEWNHVARSIITIPQRSHILTIFLTESTF
jgi:hypothetical protein